MSLPLLVTADGDHPLLKGVSGMVRSRPFELEYEPAAVAFYLVALHRYIGAAKEESGVSRKRALCVAEGVLASRGGTLPGLPYSYRLTRMPRFVYNAEYR